MVKSELTEPKRVMWDAAAAFWVDMLRVLERALYVAALPELRCFQMTSAGYNALDVPGLASTGIVVANNGGANAVSVAEHTLTLLLALQHHLLEMHTHVQAGSWSSYAPTPHRELAGSTVGITGPSGAGKSTLMMIMGGIEATTSAMITIANENLSTMNEDALAEFRRDNIGIVFQAFRLIPTMTALENVAIPLELSNNPSAFKKAKDSLGMVGLSKRLDHYPDQLSGGEPEIK